MKETIIEFSYFNGISMMHATHYYVGGRRVSERELPHWEAWLHENYKWDYTKTRTDTNKNGVRRDYTEIYFVKKD